jgi:hypothetical protein
LKKAIDQDLANLLIAAVVPAALPAPTRPGAQPK